MCVIMCVFCLLMIEIRNNKQSKLMSFQRAVFKKGLKLIIESDGQTQPPLHLFTQIPVTSFEGNPDFSVKYSHDKKYQTSLSPHSLRPLGSAHQNSSFLGQQQTPPEFLPYRRRSKKSQSKALQKSSNALRRQRVRNICRNVTRKMRMNNAFSRCADEAQFEYFRPKQAMFGWQIDRSVQKWFDAGASLVMLLLFLSQTFLLVFTELKDSPQIKMLMVLGAVVFSVEILANFMSVRREGGHKVRALSEIAYSYLTGQFCIDAAFLLVLLMQLITNNQIFNDILVCLSIFKVNSLLGKLNRIERRLFKTEYYQRYWSLLKIMLFNLAFAHAIAIALNLMAITNPEQNWQHTRGISSAWWGQRYIWSYYWATTIMLTVGFGDIAPTTYHEAVWVIVIEIVSCIAFSYNISCLGTLIGSIRSQGDLINRNRKVFQNFAEKRNLPQALTQRVLHYIDESGQVKARFSIVEERELIRQLPESFRTQVLAESNKTLLKSLPFFNQVLLRAICELSKRLERNVYFPQQTIKYARSDPHVYILQKGEVGFACRAPGSVLDRLYANTVKRTQKQEPFLLSMDFLKQQSSKYDIRAKDYSIVHRLSFQDFKTTLSAFPKDYEYYCFLRDRAKIVLDEYQTVTCKECKQKHTRFTCPRLHFMPLKEHVIHREIHAREMAKENRTISFQRILRKRQNALRQRIFLCERDKVGLSDLRDNSHQPQKIPTFSQLRGEGVLGQLKKMRTAEFSDSFLEGRHFAELFSSIKMIELRQELRDKEEAQSDQVWLLSCDRIYEYSIFFPENNLKSIVARRRKAKRAGLMQPLFSL